MSVEQKIVGKKFRNLRGGGLTLYTHCIATTRPIWSGPTRPQNTSFRATMCLDVRTEVRPQALKFCTNSIGFSSVNDKNVNNYNTSILYYANHDKIFTRWASKNGPSWVIPQLSPTNPRSRTTVILNLRFGQSICTKFGRDDHVTKQGTAHYFARRHRSNVVKQYRSFSATVRNIWTKFVTRLNKQTTIIHDATCQMQPPYLISKMSISLGYTAGNNCKMAFSEWVCSFLTAHQHKKAI